MPGQEGMNEDLKVLMDADGVPCCYQCSRCTSACPVALVTGTFNPRQIILNLLLDEDIGHMEDDIIWMCTTCHSCEEACPKGVKVASVMHHIRKEANRAGKAPAAYATNISLLLRSGLVANLATVERSRKQFDLGPVETPDMEEIEKVLDGTLLKKGGKR